MSLEATLRMINTFDCKLANKVFHKNILLVFLCHTGGEIHLIQTGQSK